MFTHAVINNCVHLAQLPNGQGSHRGAACAIMAHPGVEYLEFWVDKMLCRRAGMSPGVPPGVMTYDQAIRAQVRGPWHGGRDNTYYKYFVPGWKGQFPNFLVQLFRDYNEFALELFMQSTHMDPLDDNPNWSSITVPDRYLYKHFNHWVREASHPATQEQVCKLSHKH